MPLVRGVGILCSGFGLGFYIPGLLVSEKLRGMSIATSVEVFESLLPDDKIQMVEKNREAYHRNFRVALASQKVPGDTRDSMDLSAVHALFARWQKSDCQNFICLSGHWVHVLDLYREKHPDETIHADLLYLDADLTPSWKWLRKLKPDYASATGYREARLYKGGAVAYSIDTNSDAPVPYAQREQRLVVHGGGWGIGTFQDRVSDLEAMGYGLDVVCYAKSEAVGGCPSRRYFMDDPNWRTWHRNEIGELTLPPFGEVTASFQAAAFTPQRGCHGLHRIIRSALGIVSKPGAGTLIDSLGAATPLIMLEPFGPHEERNAEVWLAAGFGVCYNMWAEAGYPASMLVKVHQNLLAQRSKSKDYAQEYAATVLAIHR